MKVRVGRGTTIASPLATSSSIRVSVRTCSFAAALLVNIQPTEAELTIISRVAAEPSGERTLAQPRISILSPLSYRR
jgi:hypothetical protein